MKTLRALIAAAAALLPAPALADVTAHYAARSTEMTIEAADNGDWRVQVDTGNRMSIIQHAGIDYMMVRDSTGVERFARADGFFALAPGATVPRDPAIVFTTSELGSETVGGYSGTLFRFGPPGEKPLEFVMSADPRLALIAGVGRDLVALLTALPGLPLDPVQLRRIFGAGAMLRIGEAGNDPAAMLRLDSVSTALIDPARFAVTGPLLSPEAFKEASLPPAQETAPVN